MLTTALAPCLRSARRLAGTTAAAAATSIALLLPAAPAAAQQMVSIQGSSVNLRAGPKLNAEVLWEVSRGYPLKVIDRRGSWLRVQDFENDRAWVARSLTGKSPHHVVKAPIANLRSGPGTRFKVLAKLARYEVVRTRGKQPGWVRVERDDGQRGWVAKRLLWGW